MIYLSFTSFYSRAYTIPLYRKTCIYHWMRGIKGIGKFIRIIKEINLRRKMSLLCHLSPKIRNENFIRNEKFFVL